MPKQLPTPQYGPAIPLSGSYGSFSAPAGPLLIPGGSFSNPVAPAPRVTTTRAETQLDAATRDERITRLCFQAFMILNILGLAAVGYALLNL